MKNENKYNNINVNKLYVYYVTYIQTTHTDTQYVYYGILKYIKHVLLVIKGLFIKTPCDEKFEDTNEVNISLTLKRTDNTMVKTKRTKGQTMIYKILHRKQKIGQHEPNQTPGLKYLGQRKIVKIADTILLLSMTVPSQGIDFLDLCRDPFLC